MQQRTVEKALRLARDVDRLTYYDLLGIKPGADYVRVREGYHARAQVLHPDRFLGREPEARKAIYELYKRFVEAYQVLSDPQLRFEYDQEVAAGRTRLPATRRSPRLTAEEREIGNTLARVYYRSARIKQLRGDYRAAWIDVRLALSLDQAAPLRTLERTLQSRIDRQARTQGEQPKASKG